MPMLLRNMILVLLVGLSLHLPRGIAQIEDLSQWSLVEDPANKNFSAAQFADQAELAAADGPVPSGTDIGFQSVDGDTPASSLLGYAFVPDQDFTVAIDFDTSFLGSPSGFLSLGFGVGECRDGMNSAGVAMSTFNGNPFLSFGGAARIGDVDQSPIVLNLGASSEGSLFVSLNADSGNITIGASAKPGDSSPTATASFDGIQKQWNGDDLLVSFFMRSGPLTPWSGGGVGQFVFSNLRVLDGQAVNVQDPGILLGDVNTDGVVNLLDVAPFVDLLTAGQFQAEADINQDQAVNLLDVTPFVEILSGP